MTEKVGKSAAILLPSDLEVIDDGLDPEEKNQERRGALPRLLPGSQKPDPGRRNVLHRARSRPGVAAGRNTLSGGAPGQPSPGPTDLPPLRHRGVAPPPRDGDDHPGGATPTSS